MNKQKGFTLIEMLVVVAIIGILSSVVVVGLSSARSKARDARRIADIREIQNKLETNYSNSIGYTAPDSTCSSGVSIPSGATVAPGCPVDPQNSPYLYQTTSSSLSYKLGIKLENPDQNNYSAGTCPNGIAAAPAYCVTP